MPEIGLRAERGPPVSRTHGQVGAAKG